MNKRKSIIIFGLGSIGSRYAELLKKNCDFNVFAFRTGKPGAANKFGIKEIFEWTQVKRLKAEIAFITNPTSLHVKTALKCAALGMHLFIEKPLSNKLDGIDKLALICTKKQLTCYTAFCMRFHPVIKKVKELIRGKKIIHVRTVCSSYLPEWRKGRNHKQIYSSLNAMGGGVVLELSHEFDYLQYIFGELKEIKGSLGRISNITIDAEDYADVLMIAGNKTRINLHIDFLSYYEERTMKIDFADGYIFADILNGRIKYATDGKLKCFKFKISRNDYFIKQIRYFLGNIGNPLIMSDIIESKQLLEKILRFKKENSNG